MRSKFPNIINTYLGLKLIGMLDVELPKENNREWEVVVRIFEDFDEFLMLLGMPRHDTVVESGNVKINDLNGNVTEVEYVHSYHRPPFEFPHTMNGETNAANHPVFYFPSWRGHVYAAVDASGDGMGMYVFDIPAKIVDNGDELDNKFHRIIYRAFTAAMQKETDKASENDQE